MINFSELLWKPQEASPQRTRPRVERQPDPGRHARLSALPKLEVEVTEESRIVLGKSNSIERDRFRYLRTRLHEVRELAGLQTLLITSPLPQDGKSTIVLNLAATLAERGKRSVLIIEADLHRPSISLRLGLKPTDPLVATGLGQCLRDKLNPLSYVSKLNPLDCYLLPAGKQVEDPTELVQSEAWGEIVDQLTPHFDWILVDSPPLVPLADGVSLLKKCDASLLVVRAHQTPKEMVKQALGLLGKRNVLGVLFNASETVNETYAKYGSYYAET